MNSNNVKDFMAGIQHEENQNNDPSYDPAHEADMRELHLQQLADDGCMDDDFDDAEYW